MSLWSGQSPRLAKQQSAKILIQNIMAEADKINQLGDKEQNGSF
ncbi:hypothetical protein [Niallia sp. FSL W8-0954]|jgi:nitronate monooxygenase